MNPYPSPLLCLYCDKIILPGNYEGAKQHMFECELHPANGMQKALNKIINMIRAENPHDMQEVIMYLDKIAEDALR